jgi:ATP-binding protein involved in chromosome partitioning
MKIAIPVTGGKVSAHFGHCDEFALYNVNPESREINGFEMLEPPAHEPGVLPGWLHEKGANVIITGGMGQRAVSLFTENNIEVVLGIQEGIPEEVVASYLAGSLESSGNACDH